MKKQIGLIAFALTLSISCNGIAEEAVTVDPPQYCEAFSKLILENQSTPENGLITSRRRVSIDGQYEGTMYKKRVWGSGVSNCTANDSFSYTFVVGTSGKYAYVTLPNGVTATGRRKRKSFRTIIDSGDYTYRVRGKRCRGTACYFTLILTKWVTGSTYCKAKWAAWMYADK
jgi:hypothetical protein